MNLQPDVSDLMILPEARRGWPPVVGYRVRCVVRELNNPSAPASIQTWCEPGNVGTCLSDYGDGRISVDGLVWSAASWELIPPDDPMWAPPMVNPPDVVQVGPHRYRVSFDAFEHAEAQREEGTDLYGQADHSKLRIIVDPELPYDQRADTLLHEVLHCLTTHSGLAHELGAKREERMVRRLAPALLDLLRRNPQLVAYLTGGAS